MSTISEIFNRYSTVLTSLKQKIVAKGVSVAASDGFEELPAKIEAIQTGTDVSDTTLTAAAARTGYKFHLANGDLTTGTMDDATLSSSTSSSGTNRGSVTPSTSAQYVKIGTGYSAAQYMKVNAISTQSKSATPSSASQTITPDSGKYLSSVVVGAIPSNYADVSDTTAVASDVRSGKKFHKADGSLATGIIGTAGFHIQAGGTTAPTILGNITPTSATDRAISIDPGFVSDPVLAVIKKVDTETKTVTPSTSQQTVTPESGKFLSSVTVNAIPSTYVDVSDTTAVAADVLSGKKFHLADGTLATGTGGGGVQRYDAMLSVSSHQYMTVLVNGSQTSMDIGSVNVSCGFKPSLVVSGAATWTVGANQIICAVPAGTIVIPFTGGISSGTFTFPCIPYGMVSSMSITCVE